MTGNKVLILLDADVVIHFFKADRPSLPHELFPERLAMLDTVKNELFNNRTIRDVAENLFTFRQVVEIAFPTSDKEIMLEFKRLNSEMKKGKGESACMAVCRYQKHIIASSNTKDIKPYCEEFQLAYLTTLDFLCIAIIKKKITLEEGQVCVDMIKQNGSRLYTYNLKEYLEKEFDRAKINY